MQSPKLPPGAAGPCTRIADLSDFSDALLMHLLSRVPLEALSAMLPAHYRSSFPTMSWTGRRSRIGSGLDTADEWHRAGVFLDAIEQGKTSASMASVADLVVSAVHPVDIAVYFPRMTDFVSHRAATPHWWRALHVDHLHPGNAFETASVFLSSTMELILAHTGASSSDLSKLRQTQDHRLIPGFLTRVLSKYDYPSIGCLVDVLERAGQRGIVADIASRFERTEPLCSPRPSQYVAFVGENLTKARPGGFVRSKKIADLSTADVIDFEKNLRVAPWPGVIRFFSRKTLNINHAKLIRTFDMDEVAERTRGSAIFEAATKMLGIASHATTDGLVDLCNQRDEMRTWNGGTSLATSYSVSLPTPVALSHFHLMPESLLDSIRQDVLPERLLAQVTDREALIFGRGNQKPAERFDLMVEIVAREQLATVGEFVRMLAKTGQSAAAKKICDYYCMSQPVKDDHIASYRLLLPLLSRSLESGDHAQKALPPPPPMVVLDAEDAVEEEDVEMPPSPDTAQISETGGTDGPGVHARATQPGGCVCSHPVFLMRDAATQTS